jgi:hypothetical protein
MEWRDANLLDFRFSFFRSEVLLGKNGLLFKAPLSLLGMESGGLMVEAMATVFRADACLDKSLDLDMRADSILETVLERQALANDGSCCFVYSIELSVVA